MMAIAIARATTEEAEAKILFGELGSLWTFFLG